MNKPSVFISYEHSDEERDWVRRFAKSLDAQGVATWLDIAELRPGDDLRPAMEKALRTSDAIVLVLRRDAVGSPAVLFELGAALGMGKRLIPIIPRDLDPSVLPQPLRSRQYLLKDSPEETAATLASGLAA
ncbi:MAG: TIR domain-containing protein [Acidobacteria bacterium]|nr:TIR domain-containing protein [Acidobacteriota bacterium]